MSSNLMPAKFSGSTEITGEGIRKHFNSYEPWQAIIELVWNSFDAKADKVSISIVRNPINQITSVTVLDDGEGIDYKNYKNNFAKFNESAKKNDQAQHGAHGRGRLAFHRLCKDAVWFTRNADGDASISISDLSIKDFHINYLEKEQQHALLSLQKSGTCVELSEFSRDLPCDSVLENKLSTEFSWFLALHSGKSLGLNGKPVAIPSHELRTKSYLIEKENFEVKIIRWNQKPGGEKSYNYLLNSENKIVHKQHSKFNKKRNFYPSIYITSSWADTFEDRPQDLVSASHNNTSSPIWRKLLTEVIKFTREIYHDFLRQQAEKQIVSFEENGIFPDYKNESPEYAKWRLSFLKTVIKDIYIADPSVFSSLSPKQSKIIVRLLDKILVSNQNDSLLDILDNIIELDQDSLNTLSNQLQKTKLEHIISTIDILQKRELAISQLKELMEIHYKDVTETPDLQGIIENNTWLFGPAYEILGAEEDSFTKIAEELRQRINGIDDIAVEDLAPGAPIEGAQRQVDLLLARKSPHVDDQGRKYFKCTIIEIKRPGIALNHKHLQQLDEYAAIISNYPAFTSALTRFELILIGRNISSKDYAIKSRIQGMQMHGEPGLVTNDGKIKAYVKNWFTIFDEFELNNEYLLSNLKTQRDNLKLATAQELIADLQGAPLEAPAEGAEA